MALKSLNYLLQGLEGHLIFSRFVNGIQISNRICLMHIEQNIFFVITFQSQIA